MALSQVQVLPIDPPTAPVFPSIRGLGIDARSFCQSAILIAGGLLAGCFFLPVLAPSHTSAAHIVWTLLVISCSSFSYTTDNMVYSLLGLLIPYAVGLLLASSAAARLAQWPRFSAVCDAILRDIFVLLGVGMVWVLPCLCVEERTDPSATGLVLSGIVLAATALWGARQLRGPKSRTSPWLGVFLSLFCTVWFGSLFMTVDVEFGALIGGAASLLLVVAHMAEAWVVRVPERRQYPQVRQASQAYGSDEGGGSSEIDMAQTC